MRNIQVRLEGISQTDLRQAAQQMGIVITRIYPKRNQQGFLAYGYLNHQPSYTPRKSYAPAF